LAPGFSRASSSKSSLASGIRGNTNVVPACDRTLIGPSRFGSIQVQRMERNSPGATNSEPRRDVKRNAPSVPRTTCLAVESRTRSPSPTNPRPTTTNTTPPPRCPDCDDVRTAGVRPRNTSPMVTAAAQNRTGYDRSGCFHSRSGVGLTDVPRSPVELLTRGEAAGGEQIDGAVLVDPGVDRVDVGQTERPPRSSSMSVLARHRRRSTGAGAAPDRRFRRCGSWISPPTGCVIRGHTCGPAQAGADRRVRLD
jgi:hypothetical protein